MTKVAILAEDDQGNYYAITCADTDQAVEALRAEIDHLGFTARGQVYPLSLAAFRQMARRPPHALTAGSPAETE